MNIPYDLVKYEIYKYAKDQHKYVLKCLNEDMYLNCEYIFENKYFEIENGIIEAIKESNVNKFNFLIKISNNKIKFDDMQYLLICCEYKNNYEIFVSIIENLEDNNIVIDNNYGKKLIVKSIKSRNTKIMKYLFENIYSNGWNNDWKNDIIKKAFIFGKIKILKYVIDFINLDHINISIFKISYIDKHNNRMCDNYEYLKNMYVYGHDIFLEDYDDKTYNLLASCKYKGSKLFKYFAKLFNDVYKDNMDECLLKAIKYENIEIIEYIFEDSVNDEEKINKVELIFSKKNKIFGINYSYHYTNNIVSNWLLKNDYMKYVFESDCDPKEVLIKSIKNKNKKLSKYILDEMSARDLFEFLIDEKVLFKAIKNYDIYVLDYFFSKNNNIRKVFSKLFKKFILYHKNNLDRRRYNIDKRKLDILKIDEANYLILLNWKPFLNEIIGLIDKDFIKLEFLKFNLNVVNWASKITNIHITNNEYMDCIINSKNPNKYYLKMVEWNDDDKIKIIMKIMNKRNNFLKLNMIKLLYNKNIDDELLERLFHNIIDECIYQKDLKWMSETRFKKYFEVCYNNCDICDNDDSLDDSLDDISDSSSEGNRREILIKYKVSYEKDRYFLGKFNKRKYYLQCGHIHY